MSVIDSNKFNISIHALREESDKWQYSRKIIKRHFNPRSPWGERLVFLLYKPIGLGFQSTLSVRRATAITILTIIINPNFNPRSPWGERHRSFWNEFKRTIWFQSTLSVRRATIDFLSILWYTYIFQSTLSVRRATGSQSWQPLFLSDFNPRSPWGERQVECILFDEFQSISIHALREESDRICRASKYLMTYFNPCSPWGERLLSYPLTC